MDEDSTVILEKSMTIPDSLIIKYFELVIDIHLNEIEEIKMKLEEGNVNPRDIKIELAKQIVQLYHGKEAALAAEVRFKNVFQKG